MALGSTAKTHTKRAAVHARSAKSHAIKASRAAKKGKCRTAIIELVNAGVQAGMRTAERHGATKHVRKVLGGKGWKKAVKGFNKTFQTVVSHCHKA